MSLTPQSAAEILAEYETQLAAQWGPTVLSDPAGNRSSNLVRLLAMPALSLSDIQAKVEALILEQNPINLEGTALTSYAALRGIQRRTGTQSKTVIMVTGQQGAILPAGSELLDRFDGVWTTVNDITLESVGVGCAYGMGIACSNDVGTFTLDEDELRYDNTITPFIFSASNGLMLEIGGTEESDEAFRRRILARGPLANVVGTADNASAAVLALDGVEFVRYEFVDDPCLGSGPMFIVYGGNDPDICNTIARQSGVSCNLVGETECGSCTDVRFQRPCPVLLKIEVTVNNDCPILTFDQIASVIMSVAPSIARQQKVRAADIANLQQDIDAVRFQLCRQELYVCPEQDAPEYTDPLSGQPFRFGTSNPYGVCAGQPSCIANGDFVNTIEINPWEYFVMDQTQITFVTAAGPESGCNQCLDEGDIPINDDIIIGRPPVVS